MYERLKGRLKKGYLKNVMCALKWGTGREGYGEIIREISEEIRGEREENTNRFEKIDWKRIEKPRGEGVEDVIKGLYTIFPPRRLSDYAYMRYEEEEREGDDNYYIKGGTMIFNNYKTVGKYGKQRFKVEKELREIIERYVKREGIREGEWLLKYRRGSDGSSKRTLERKLKKIFGTSVDGLRHGYITSLYKEGRNLYKIKETSEKMGHDIETHLTYMDKENKN